MYYSYTNTIKASFRYKILPVPDYDKSSNMECFIGPRYILGITSTGLDPSLRSIFSMQYWIFIEYTMNLIQMAETCIWHENLFKDSPT